MLHVCMSCKSELSLSLIKLFSKMASAQGSAFQNHIHKIKLPSFNFFSAEAQPNVLKALTQFGFVKIIEMHHVCWDWLACLSVYWQLCNLTVSVFSTWIKCRQIELLPVKFYFAYSKKLIVYVINTWRLYKWLSCAFYAINPNRSQLICRIRIQKAQC